LRFLFSIHNPSSCLQNIFRHTVWLNISPQISILSQRSLSQPSAYQNRSTSYRPRQYYIPSAHISNKIALTEIKAEIRLGLKEHARQRLPTGTAILFGVRATVDSI
jgi:hypothetical protein